MLNEVFSIFTIFLYIVPGTYVLSKNMHDRTNKFFGAMMFVFTIWALTAFPEGISRDGLAAKKELFLFSSVFAIGGIYILLRLYSTSRYRVQEWTKLILACSIAAISAVILAGIILPMFFDLYFISPLILAPAMISACFALAVYRHGHFIIPVPEFSITSFCGAECKICPEYIEKRCSGCRFDMERYGNCAAYKCSAEKGYHGCIECSSTISCTKRNEKMICFSSKPIYNLKPGSMYMADDKGFDIFLDSVRHGASGIIASTTDPYLIKERSGFATTPMIWISAQGGESDVRPNDLKRLELLLTNFMKNIDKSGSSIILLDGSGMLFRINGSEKFERFIKTLGTAAGSTKSTIIVTADHNDELIGTVLRGKGILETPEISSA